jgi:hypothetical protein
MRKIDKAADKIVSTKYKAWVDKLDAAGTEHGNSRTYYDDVAMNLYKCQLGVCAYTEMFICPHQLYDDANWEKGRYKIPPGGEYSRIDHLGEMDHYDPQDKKLRYWNWDNLFMIHAKINGIKSNESVVSYLKPDLAAYSPQKYFDYDDQTHRFVPNTDIEDEVTVAEIQHMIDKVLYLNHGVVRNERRNYINSLKDKRKRGEEIIVDRFFTSVNSVIGE